MAYDPTPGSRPVRDYTNVAEVAAKRPMLVTRFQCTEDDLSGDDTIRGSAGNDPCELFNSRLRGR